MYNWYLENHSHFSLKKELFCWKSFCSKEKFPQKSQNNVHFSRLHPFHFALGSESPFVLSFGVKNEKSSIFFFSQTNVTDPSVVKKSNLQKKNMYHVCLFSIFVYCCFWVNLKSIVFCFVWTKDAKRTNFGLFENKIALLTKRAKEVLPLG